MTQDLSFQVPDGTVNSMRTGTVHFSSYIPSSVLPGTLPMMALRKLDEVDITFTGGNQIQRLPGFPSDRMTPTGLNRNSTLFIPLPKIQMGTGKMIYKQPVVW